MNIYINSVLTATVTVRLLKLSKCTKLYLKIVIKMFLLRFGKLKLGTISTFKLTTRLVSTNVDKESQPHRKHGQLVFFMDLIGNFAQANFQNSPLLY